VRAAIVARLTVASYNTEKATMQPNEPPAFTARILPLLCAFVLLSAMPDFAGAESSSCPAPPSAFGSKDKLDVGIEGKIYFVAKNTRALPDFSKLESEGSIYTARWDVPPRRFTEGFPGVTNRFEWFAIDYKGKIYVPKTGTYAFRLGSDDASALWIDGKRVVNGDWLHAWGFAAGKAELPEGDHDFRLGYMQGPAYTLGLQLFVTPPGEKERIFALQDFSRDVLASRSNLTVTETANEIRVNVGAQVLFDTGKYALRPESTELLHKVATLVQSYPGLPIVIEGHTDSVGSTESNQTLSQNRARAVVEWLAKNSAIPAGCLSSKGFGETRPVATNDTSDGRQLNRRVEVKIQKSAAAAAPKH
jgi:outer membrane protein OmpA-like peptidoglycan-associated protein